MRTRRVLSNISFNTLDFFEHTINELYDNGSIDWAYWIVHKGDVDDKKDHIHFCFQPSSIVDTVVFSRQFLEFPFHGCRLPLKATSKFNPVSQLDDWLLYCKHDIDYLTLKGLTRNYHYQWEDFHFTDRDAFFHDVGNIDVTKYGKLTILREGVEKRIPFAELVQRGQLPIAYRAQYEAQYRALQFLYPAGD